MSQTSSKPSSLKSVLRFRTVKDYLGHYYAYRKCLDSSFGYRILAKECGLSSASYLQMVIAGKRALSGDVVHIIATLVKMSFREHEYFENLALIENAKSPSVKVYYQRKLRSLKKSPEINSVQIRKLSSKSEILPHWKLMPLVAILTATDGYFSFEELLERLQIEKNELNKQIEILKEMGTVSEVDGKLKIQLDSVSFYDPKDFSGAQKKILEQFLKFSVTAFEKKYDRSKFYSHTFTANTKRISELDSEIRNFFSNLTKSGSEHDSNDIVQVNLQCFDLFGVAE